MSDHESGGEGLQRSGQRPPGEQPPRKRSRKEQLENPRIAGTQGAAWSRTATGFGSLKQQLQVLHAETGTQFLLAAIGRNGKALVFGTEQLAAGAQPALDELLSAIAQYQLKERTTQEAPDSFLLVEDR